MSAVIWIDEAAELGVDLGDPFQLMREFKGMAALDDTGDYGHLFAVPQLLEEEVDLAEISAEARLFLSRYREKMTPHAVWILEQLEGQKT